MNASLPLAAALAAIAIAACSHPKATVVEEPKPQKPATRQNATKPEPNTPRNSAPPLGLRDPDVVSELPDSPPAQSNPAGATDPANKPGTVIVRPPR